MIAIFVASLLSGTVLDAVTQAPIARATVILPVRGEIALTDVNGRFTVEVPDGQYQVVVQAAGYEQRRYLDVQTIRQGESLVFSLSPGGGPADTTDTSTYQVGETTVTASRTVQRTIETPREVRVLGHERIREQQPLGTPEALAEAPEVLVQKTNLGGGAPIIRGLAGNRVLLIVDGVRLNNSTYRIGLNQYLNTIDQGIIDRIEVVPGAGSALYGSDALGGVVEVSTVEPSPGAPEIAYSGRVTAAEGSSTQTLRLSRWFGSGGVLIGGSFRDLNDLRAGGGIGVQRPTGFTEWSANARARIETSDTGALSLAYQMTRQDDVPRTDRIVAGRDSVWTYDPQERRLAFVRFEATEPTADVQFARVTASLNQQREGRIVIGSGSDTRTEELDDTRTFGLSAEARSLMGPRTLLVYGAEGYFDFVDSEGLEIDLASGAIEAREGKFPADGEHVSAGAFVQAQRTLSPATTIIGAIRFSLFRLTGTPQGFDESVTIENAVVTGSTQARFQIGDDDFAFAGVSQAFRAPSMEDALSTGLSNKGLDVPNPGLDPERSLSFEAGVKTAGHLTPDDWLSEDPRKTFSIDITAYATIIDDLVERTPATFMGSDSIDGNPVFRNENLGRARIIGATVNGALRFHPFWTLRASAAVTHGQNTDLDVPLTRIPPPRGVLSLRRDLGRVFVEAVGLWALRQERLSPDDLRDSRIPDDGTPAYVVGSLRTGVSLSNGLSFRAALENVADDGYRVHGSGIDAPGRNLTVGIAWEGSPFSAR